MINSSGKNRVPNLRKLRKARALEAHVHGITCPRCTDNDWTDWYRAENRWRRYCHSCGRCQTAKHRDWPAKPPADLRIPLRNQP